MPMDKIVTMDISKIGYAPQYNYSRVEDFDYLSNITKLTETVASFIEDKLEGGEGWKAEKPVHVHEAASALDDRTEALWAARVEKEEFWSKVKLEKPLKINLPGIEKVQTFHLSSADLLAGFNATFYRKGKMAHADKSGVSGHRRNHAVVIANAILIQLGLEPITKIAVIVSEYKTLLDLQSACFWENDSQQVGVVALTGADKLRTAKAMYDANASESFMRKKFKDGMGQKLFGICNVDAKYGTTLVEECINDWSKAGCLTAKKCRELRDTYDEAERKLDDDESTAAEIKVAKENQNPETVMAFFKNPPGANAAKIAGKDEIKRLMDQASCKLIKTVAKAIVNNTIASLKPYNENAAAINTAIEAIMAGGEVVEDGGIVTITKN